MIPKTIYTCWFSHNSNIPAQIQKCIDSQKIQGYEHKLITLENVITDHPYINQCLSSPHKTKKWVKLKDFVQYYYLYHLGGWFLDADVEMVEGKNFDEYYHENFVIGIEGRGTINDSIVIGSAVVGSSQHNPILLETLDKVVANFRGDDDKCFESSLDILSLVCIEQQDKVKFTEPDVFYPYNHHTGETNITKNTVCIHKFTKSWVLPTISVILPHLGKDRELGLTKCIKSIKDSNYPQDLIEIYVDNGEGTVPEKVKSGVEHTKGDYIVYAANDMEFLPDCIRNAVDCSIKNGKALVSFNEGALLPDKGNINTHFLIKRDFLPFIGGDIFSLELHHVGVDNLLWKKAEDHNQAMWCEDAKIIHNHFSKTGKFDDVYAKGWEYVNEDREKLKELLKQ